MPFKKIFWGCLIPPAKQTRDRKPFSWQSGKLLQRFPITFIEAFLGAPPELDFHVE